MDEARYLIAADPVLSKNLALVRSITGFGEISATILLAELPNIADFTPKALAAFVGLSPSEHSSGTSVRRPGKVSRIGTEPSVPMMMRHRPPGSLALRVLKDDLAHAHDPDPDRR